MGSCFEWQWISSVEWGHCVDGVVMGGGGGAGGCWSYFGISIQRCLSAWGWESLGLAWPFITWEVTPIDMDSDIKYHACFFFRKLCPKLRHEIIIGTEKNC